METKHGKPGLTGINNISLSPHLLAGLYQHVLVQDGAAAPSKLPVPFLGTNGRNILIVVNKAVSPFLSDKELEFLTTVLSACLLDLSHVAIVNHHHFNEKKNMPLFEQFSPKEILLLDVSAKEFKLPAVENYKVKETKGLRFVAAPDLSFIEKSRDEKKALWASLQQLFCLNRDL